MFDDLNILEKHVYETSPRVWAYVVDVIVIAFLYFGYSVIFVVASDMNADSMYFYIDYAIFQMVYFLFFAFVNGGRTFGKWLFKLRIYGGSKVEVSKSSIVIRELVKSMLWGVNLISFLISLFRKDNKALHDLLTDTIVLQKKIIFLNNQKNDEIIDNENDSEEDFFDDFPDFDY